MSRAVSGDQLQFRVASTTGLGSGGIAIEDYITGDKGVGIYLLTDRVDIHVEQLGVVHNRVVP